MSMGKVGKRILIVVSVLFWSGMLLLTVFSEQLYYAVFPKVEIAKASKRKFEQQILDADGNLQAITTFTALAVPVTALQGEYVYVLETVEEELVVNTVRVNVGPEQDGYVEVQRGLQVGERIVSWSECPLEDGMIVVEKE